ncbi:MAG: DUF4276 family protein [Deltaproteobacteria bacterium]|jgi:hypothetical protein|nr:DUF4276 family protein [Deltaproteobacteria bacterium]
MSCLACILEEQSAAEMLKVLFSRIDVPKNISIRYVVFEGKQDLEKQIERKLRGWQQAETFFLILRDQDAGNCIEIKDALKEKSRAAGKIDKTIVRIACHELESFYLGDLAAVEKGLKLSNIASRQREQKYREPDKLVSAARELRILTNDRYQKMCGSRSIASFLKVDGTNRSKSFNVLLSGIQKAISTLCVNAAIV